MYNYGKHSYLSASLTCLCPGVRDTFSPARYVHMHVHT